MKTILSIFLFFFIAFNISAQNIGINETGALPDKSALLDLKSESKGLLVPRLTTAQRDAILDPADFLQIMNTSTRCFEVYDANNSSWVSVNCLCPLPDAPSVNAGSNILDVGFDASWSVAYGATNYYIDVADDAGFTNLIIDNQSVGNVTSYNVNGLTCETDYYYRIRAGNSCGTIVSSNTEMISTGTCCPTTLAVGDLFEGGIIFEVSPTGSCQTGKIVSLNDLGEFEWGKQGTLTSATSETDGAANTTTIIDVNGPIFEDPYAADECRNYSGGGFNDWYLPALDELTAIYNIKVTVNTGLSNNGGTAISNDDYWSSTENNAYNCDILDFDDGDDAIKNKFTEIKTRAIRAF